MHSCAPCACAGSLKLAASKSYNERLPPMATSSRHIQVSRPSPSNTFSSGAGRTPLSCGTLALGSLSRRACSVRRFSQPCHQSAPRRPTASLAAGGLPSAAAVAAVSAAAKLHALLAAGGGYISALAGQYAPYAPLLAAPLVSAWQGLGARIQP